jgi:hypothetical protein
MYKLYVSVCPKTTAILYGRTKEQDRTCYALVAALVLVFFYLMHIHSNKQYKIIYSYIYFIIATA